MSNMTIEELAERTQTSPRTIRYYIAEGMLTGPGARGRAASYGDEHLERLQLVRALLERHLPLAEIKRMLVGLSPEEIRTLLREELEQQTALQQAAQAPSPRRYISELLRQTRAQHAPHATDAGPQRATSLSLPEHPMQAEPAAGAARAARPTSVPPPGAAATSSTPPAFWARTSSTPPSNTPMRAAAWPQSTWQHIELTPNIALLVRAEAAEELQPLIAALIALVHDAGQSTP